MPPPSDPTRWPEIKRLFEAALALDANERGSFLDRECRASGGRPDAELHEAVATLLEADAEAETVATGGFLAVPPLRLNALARSRARPR